MSLEILVLPVSGGYFISQGAITAKIMEARNNISGGPAFDIHFSASGGNLISLMNLLYKDTSESLERLIYTLNSDIFVRNHFQGKLRFLPSVIAGILENQGIYKSGKGSEDLVKNYFDQDLFRRSTTAESWNLTYNIDTNLGEINCTKSESDSIIGKYIDKTYLKTFGLGEINYRNGDLDLITGDVKASASVPGLKKAEKVNGKRYKDGGISRSSPSAFFNEAIQEMRNAGSHNGAFHCCYIFGSNMYKYTEEDQNFQKHWFRELLEDVISLTTSLLYSDKQIAFENWLRTINKRKSQCTKEVIENITSKNLKTKFETYDSKHYFMTFYTGIDISVNITNFDTVDLKKKYKEAIENVNVEIYYIDV